MLSPTSKMLTEITKLRRANGNFLLSAYKLKCEGGQFSSDESFWICPILSRNATCIRWGNISRMGRTQSFLFVLEIVTVAVLSRGTFTVRRLSNFGGYKTQVGNLLKLHLPKPYLQKF